MYIESLSIATLEQAIHLREEVFPGVSNSSDSPLSNNIQEYCKLVAIPRYMKSFICYVTLLLFGASLLANSRSTANESSITSNSLVVAETISSEEFIARGTEPFWSVTVSKKRIVYSSPDTKQQTFSYVAPLKAEARPADLAGRQNGLECLYCKECSNLW